MIQPQWEERYSEEKSEEKRDEEHYEGKEHGKNTKETNSETSINEGEARCRNTEEKNLLEDRIGKLSTTRITRRNGMKQILKGK